MDLKAIQRGAFDLVEAVRFLADKMDALESALQAGGPGPNMDAGTQGADLGPERGAAVHLPGGVSG